MPKSSDVLRCIARRRLRYRVWLRGGDAWDASIRRQIKERALFLPVISSRTEAPGENDFRLEWPLAVERSSLVADEHVFLRPVVIDEATGHAARAPGLLKDRDPLLLLTDDDAHCEELTNRPPRL